MGLSIEVGVYSGIEDADGSDHFDQMFASMAQAMTAAGLPAHVEPKDVASWTVPGHGYSGLHALREVAALLYCGLPIPRSPLISGQEPDPPALDLFNLALEALEPPKLEKPKGIFARCSENRTKRQLLQEPPCPPSPI